MSDEQDNPFATPPADTGGKMVFGTYQMIANRVAFGESGDGTAYEMARYTDKDDNPRPFKGKRLEPKSKTIHIIQDVTCQRKDGSEYVTFRDWMWSGKDVCYKAVIASHKKFFGADLAGINGKKVEAQLETIEVDDKGYNRQCFKVVAVFESKAERNKARDAYFAQFTRNGNGATESTDTGLHFSADSISTFKKHSKKGAKAIAEAYVEDSVLEQYGLETVIAEVEKLIA